MNMKVVYLYILWFALSFMLVGCNVYVSMVEARALKGNIQSQVRLGTLYYEGKIIPQDIDTAITWLEPVATSGVPEAQYMLGEIFFGYKKNFQNAYYWYERAALNGVIAAKYMMGSAYIWGTEEIVKDPIKGIAYLKASSNEGYIASRGILGEYYFQKMNYKESYFWIKLAVDSGFKHSLPFLRRLDKLLSEDEKAEVEQRIIDSGL